MQRIDTKKLGNEPAPVIGDGQARRKMRYCSKCVYPEIAVFVTLEDDGVCSGCRVNAHKPDIDWNERGQMLKEILDEFRSKDGSNYDCIIPVSGG
jgi:hypothetical protein